MPAPRPSLRARQKAETRFTIREAATEPTPEEHESALDLFHRLGRRLP